MAGDGLGGPGGMVAKVAKVALPHGDLVSPMGKPIVYDDGRPSYLLGLREAGAMSEQIHGPDIPDPAYEPCIYCGRRPPLMLDDDGEILPYDGAPICRPCCPPKEKTYTAVDMETRTVQTYTEHDSHEMDEMSLEAHEAIQPTLGTRRRQVLTALEKLGGKASAEELADFLEWDKFHVMPRITELRKARLLEKTGEHRKTRNGKGENVWRLL